LLVYLIGNLIDVGMLSLLGTALILQGVLHARLVSGMKVLMDTMITNTLLLQRVSLLMMNRWILEPICRKI
jgi:hypothetical protein